MPVIAKNVNAAASSTNPTIKMGIQALPFF
jgi:hypothetical protein